MTIELPKAPKLPQVYRRAHTARRMVSNARGQWISHAQHARVVVLLEAHIERLRAKLRAANLDVERMNHLEREANQVREEGDPPTLRVAVDMKRART